MVAELPGSGTGRRLLPCRETCHCSNQAAPAHRAAAASSRAAARVGHDRGEAARAGSRQSRAPRRRPAASPRRPHPWQPQAGWAAVRRLLRRPRQRRQRRHGQTRAARHPSRRGRCQRSSRRDHGGRSGRGSCEDGVARLFLRRISSDAIERASSVRVAAQEDIVKAKASDRHLGRLLGNSDEPTRADL